MTRGLQRATFNRSALVRLLSEVAPETSDPKYDFGERLGQWLDFSDALTLSSVLTSSTGALPAAQQTPATAGMAEQLARLRQSLSDAILNDGVFTAEPARVRFPTPLPQATADSAADFSPYHRYYLAHQRDMGAAIAALRSNARKALAALSPAHKQLAQLDIAFENILTARERNLLASIPLLLAKRFAQHYQNHRDTLAADAGDDPADWTQPGSWLEAFCQDTQAVLLAELELRLKPVAGLIAALGAASDNTPPVTQ